MTYKLFIDDERFPPDDGTNWTVVRTSDDALKLCKLDCPSFISFDHDLGGDDTSMVFLHAWIDWMLDNQISLPKDFDFYVHSQNPIGAENIRNLLTSFKKHNPIV